MGTNLSERVEGECLELNRGRRMPGIGYHTDQENMVLAPHPRDTETQEHWLTKSSEFLEASLNNSIILQQIIKIYT